jgi:O-antigen ligase/Flp pilus assembly protein TadD
VCGYALLSKIFPNAIGVAQNNGHVYARLQAPYGYWNAIGLAAALGAIGCMWLGARRAGHALLSALAYPAMGLMLVTLMLAYSRGALAALVLGLALWFCLVPLRLRGATVLIVGALGAAVVVAWDFSKAVLTTDSATLAARIYAGHQLGVLLAAMLLALLIAGLAVGFLGGRHPPSPLLRRRAGTLLLSLPVIAVIAFGGLLAVSHRGLFGSVSHGVHSLTDPDAAVPANGPGRLTAIGSARARYWKEALEVFKAHPLLGSGAEGYATARLRYRTAPIKVQQAHGYVVQTLADLGLVGLLLTLALLAAWMVAAGRATHPFNRRWSAWRWRRWPHADRAGAPGVYTAERVGLLTMLCLVATFGVHSFVDWTWYVPGLACVALLCAGWLAGRGPLTAILAPAGSAPAGRVSAGGASAGGASAGRVSAGGTSAGGASAGRVSAGGTSADEVSAGGVAAGKRAAGIAVAVVIAALLAAWAEWQPQRSVEASNQALTLIKGDPGGALAAAHAAVSRDPLSAEALITLAAIQQGTGQGAAARATYVHAVHIQPSNWQTWEVLGEYELQRGHSAGALNALRAAVYLNPEAVAPNATIDDEELLTLRDDYLQALRDTARAAPSPAARVALRAAHRSRAS